MLLTRDPGVPLRRAMGSPRDNPGSHRHLDGSHRFHKVPQETGTSEEGLKQQ